MKRQKKLNVSQNVQSIRIIKEIHERSQNLQIFKYPGKRLGFLTWKYAHLANA